MRKYLFFSLFALFLGKTNLYGQSSDKEVTHIFRIYEDNDFLNIRGKGTDKSYTNGLRLDVLFTKKKKSRFFIDWLMPKAGNKSINVFGWSLTQLMFTPNNILSVDYQPNDYPYAGALFATHTLYSYNTVKKYSFQTEFVAGIRGPASFAKEFQTYAHSVINYDKPMGWANQLKTSPLINVNFTVEKQLLLFSNFMEIIGAVQVAVGSYIDAASFYSLIRIGKMAHYFDGYLAQHGSFYKKGRKYKTQYYLVLKPENTFVIHNSLVCGKRMNDDSDRYESKHSVRQLRHCLTDIQFGVEIAHGNFGFSYLQTHSTEFDKGLYSHNWGNVSLYYRW